MITFGILNKTEVWCQECWRYCDINQSLGETEYLTRWWHWKKWGDTQSNWDSSSGDHECMLMAFHVIVQEINQSVTLWVDMHVASVNFNSLNIFGISYQLTCWLNWIIVLQTKSYDIFSVWRKSLSNLKSATAVTEALEGKSLPKPGRVIQTNRRITKWKLPFYSGPHSSRRS